jgi:hypothetical protein
MLPDFLLKTLQQIYSNHFRFDVNPVNKEYHWIKSAMIANIASIDRT